MKKRVVFPLFVICLLALAFSGLLPARPADASTGQPQSFAYTPTAQPDGRILYRVQPGDTCIGVSLRMGVSVEQIQLLNGIRGGECTLIADTDILIATVAPQATLMGPTPTLTPAVPSATPFAGNGEVCVQLFNDLNGNARVEEGELPLGGGAVSLNDRVGKVSETGNTSPDPEQPVCFVELPEGDYTISMAVPDGYNATTRTTYELSLRAGDRSLLDFGAQMSAAAEPPAPSEGGRSPLMGIIGGLVLVIGAGLGVYARLLTRK